MLKIQIRCKIDTIRSYSSTVEFYELLQQFSLENVLNPWESVSAQIIIIVGISTRICKETLAMFNDHVHWKQRNQ